MHDNDQKTGESRAHVLESVVRKSGSWMTENPEVILGARLPGSNFLGFGRIDPGKRRSRPNPCAWHQWQRVGMDRDFPGANIVYKE
jgi:hypothetical protein